MNNDKVKPAISFESYRINSLEYREANEEEKQTPVIEGGFGSGIIDEKQKGIVNQKVTTYNPKTKMLLKLEISAIFDIVDETLSKDEINKFLALNGSAMIYPYVRAITSLVSSLDSSENTVLPSLNFSDAYENSLHDDK